MVVGPAGAGKTAMMDCLAAALTEMGQKTVIWRMNPKVGPAYLACGLLIDISYSISRTTRQGQGPVCVNVQRVCRMPCEN